MQDTDLMKFGKHKHKTKMGFNPIILEKDFKFEDEQEAIEQAKKHFAETFGFKPEIYNFEILTK
mgnify:CR=1 FL=1